MTYRDDEKDEQLLLDVVAILGGIALGIVFLAISQWRL